MPHSPNNDNSDRAVKQGLDIEKISITTHKDTYQFAQLSKQDDGSMGSLFSFLFDMEEHEEHHHKSKASNNNLLLSDTHERAKLCQKT